MEKTLAIGKNKLSGYKKLVKTLIEDPYASIDELVVKTGIGRSTIVNYITFLTGCGVVVRVPGRHRVRTIDMKKAKELGLT
jgi:Fic family protein